MWIYKTNISPKRAPPSTPISSELVKATDIHLPRERVWSKCGSESQLFRTAEVSKQRICTRKCIKHRCSDSHHWDHAKPHRPRESGQHLSALSHPCNYQCLWERIRSTRLQNTYPDLLTLHVKKNTPTPSTRARLCHFTATWAMAVSDDREALTALWKAL